MAPESSPLDPALRCSFCHKSESEVAKLIANPPGSTPRVYICDECIQTCHSILEKGSTAPGHPVTAKPLLEKEL